MKSLSLPLRRSLALALLVFALGALYFGIVTPILDKYAQDRDAIAQLNDSLDRYRAVARTLAPRQALLAEISRRSTATDDFMKGPNDTLIATQIQNQIKRLADNVKGDLKSTQVLPAQAEGKLHRITVRGQLSATLPAALQIVHGLESTSPALFIDNANLRARPAPVRRGQNSEPDPEIIEMQLDVYGYARGDD
jgi:general secretion pathway protein M